MAGEIRSIDATWFRVRVAPLLSVDLLLVLFMLEA
jgi:hypothetical protein